MDHELLEVVTLPVNAYDLQQRDKDTIISAFCEYLRRKREAPDTTGAYDLYQLMNVNSLFRLSDCLSACNVMTTHARALEMVSEEVIGAITIYDDELLAESRNCGE